MVLGAAALGLGRGVASASDSTPSGGGLPSGGSTGGAKNEDTPRVPHNNVAAIYDLFGARGEPALKDIKGRLESEGYKVNLYQDTIEGSAPGHGNATLHCHP